ncbi:hypothetical protein [Nocardioides daejeonensis]|uniref:hypothetical protein n=1 Tax=Nocardioides daejeonensis TaxID=1046556 RepID=UPI000D745DE3|nr:hypothetical protein [Nocardioides daejeonensis]
MNHTRLSAAAAGLLVVGLTFGATPAAQAKVTAKDVPSKADITKAFSALKSGQFASGKGKAVNVPGKTCGTYTAQKVKSAASISGAADAGISATASVAEFKSVAQAKSHLSKYKKFVKKCKSFTEPTTSAKVTLKKVSSPKVGQDRIAVQQVTVVLAGTPYEQKGYAHSVTIRQGKRIAVVLVSDKSKVSSKKINKLAKVAAKKAK